MIAAAFHAAGLGKLLVGLMGKSYRAAEPEVSLFPQKYRIHVLCYSRDDLDDTLTTS